MKSSSALPTASGGFGDKPTLTFPTSGPPAALKTAVLTQGTGPAVAKNDLMVVNYLGQIWNGTTFDNSYDRKAPTTFTIGAGKVIPGWDSTLVGLKAGTRILMSIPPADGYGPSGNAQAGIKGTDTLVFVVDVVGSYGSSVGPDPKAAVQPAAATGPQVSGALSGKPTITIPKGTPEPTQPMLTVLAKGTGKPIAKGTAVVQLEAVSWAGQTVSSSRTTGQPDLIPVGGSQSTVFDKVVGTPIGSRVLLVIPANSAQTSASAAPTAVPAVAVVIDLVDELPAGVPAS